MLNTTKKKARRIIVEKIDFRIDPGVKREFYRISVEGELPLEISPDEFHRLEKIARSYRKNKKERKPKVD
jgi:hypothetical protein